MREALKSHEYLKPIEVGKFFEEFRIDTLTRCKTAEVNHSIGDGDIFSTNGHVINSHLIKSTLTQFDVG